VKSFSAITISPERSSERSAAGHFGWFTELGTQFSIWKTPSAITPSTPRTSVRFAAYCNLSDRKHTRVSGPSPGILPGKSRHRRVFADGARRDASPPRCAIQDRRCSGSRSPMEDAEGTSAAGGSRCGRLHIAGYATGSSRRSRRCRTCSRSSRRSTIMSMKPCFTRNSAL
jgi:hypothetical protein